MNLVATRTVAAGGFTGLLGLRLLLFAGMALLLVAVIGYLRQAWRRRAAQQEEDLPELLTPPEQPGTVTAAPLRGAYLGTTDAGHWLEWFSARGLDGKDGGYISVYESGVRMDRRGKAFWIPREAVRGARLERAHAGKVATPGRLLVIAWSLDGRELETGFRGEDRSRQPKVMRSIHDLIGPAAAPQEGEITAPRPMMVARTLRQLRSRRPHGGPEEGRHQAARPRGGHHGGVGRRAAPGRRGAARTPEQEIADRRGADPYGTGPRAAAAPGLDPYVTNPRGVPYGTGAPGAAPVTPARGGPRPAPAAPPAEAGPTNPYGAPAAPPAGRRGGQPPAGQPRPAAAPGQGYPDPRAGQPDPRQPPRGWPRARPAAAAPDTSPYGAPPVPPSAAARPSPPSPAAPTGPGAGGYRPADAGRPAGGTAPRAPREPTADGYGYPAATAMPPAAYPAPADPYGAPTPRPGAARDPYSGGFPAAPCGPVDPYAPAGPAPADPYAGEPYAPGHYRPADPYAARARPEEQDPYGAPYGERTGPYEDGTGQHGHPRR